MLDWFFHYLRRGIAQAVKAGFNDGVQAIADQYEQRVADGEIEIHKVGYLEDQS